MPQISCDAFSTGAGWGGGGLHLRKHQGLLSLGLGHESFLQLRGFHAMKSLEGPGPWETLKHLL